MQLSERALGRDHPMIATVTTVLAQTLLERDRASEAVLLAERAWAIRQREDIPATRRADSAFVLARAMRATGQSPERVRELAETAAEIYAEADPPRTDKRDEVLMWLREPPAR
jgi:hypothetical protein